MARRIRRHNIEARWRWVVSAESLMSESKHKAASPLTCFSPVNLPNSITLARIGCVPLFLWILSGAGLHGVHGRQELLAAAVFLLASLDRRGGWLPGAPDATGDDAGDAAFSAGRQTAGGHCLHCAGALCSGDGFRLDCGADCGTGIPGDRAALGCGAGEA